MPPAPPAGPHSPGRADQPGKQRKSPLLVSARSRRSSDQYRVEVFSDRAVERVRDVCADLAGLYPCHGVEFFLIGDVGCAGERVGFYVEHLPFSRRVDPDPDNAPRSDDQAGFLEGLADGCVFGAFAWFHLACGELPAERALGHSPADEEEPTILDDDRCGDCGLI